MKTCLRLSAAAAALSLASIAAAAVPEGWFVAGSRPGDYEYSTDQRVAYDGVGSASIKAKAEAGASGAPAGFGTLMQAIAADNYRGSRMRLSAYLKTEQAHRAQMWLRINGAGPDHKMLAFDNMDSRPLTGTTEWTRCEIVLDVPPDSANIAFGFFLIGSGQVWGDAFQLEKVDKSTPLTGTLSAPEKEPRNVDFEK